MKKFDLYEELKANDYVEVDDGFGRKHLVKHYEKEVEVCWYGKHTSTFDVEVYFNSDHTVARVYYYNQSKTPFKTKVHMNDKRAYNAICATLNNNGYNL